MPNKTLLFLCSGGGGNLRFVHQAILRGWLPGWRYIAVITDRECPASDYACQNGLPVDCIDFESDEQATLRTVALSHEPDMIVTTVHKILGKAFLTAFEGKMLNLHYSLLPSFAGSIGVSPVRAALDYGACLGGATVHRVTAELDAGRPVAQIAFPLMPGDVLAEVMDVEFRAGCIALLSSLLAFDSRVASNVPDGVLRIKGRHALLNPTTALPYDLHQDDFWAALK